MGLGNPLGVVERPVRAAVRGAGAAADRIDRILQSLEVLGGTLGSIETEMRGMRADLREAVNGIEALRGDVHGLDNSVGGIRDATKALEQQVVGLDGHLHGLGKSLRRLDALVPRLTRRSRAGHPE